MSNQLLAIDIGNSHTTVGLFTGEKLIGTWRLMTRVPRTEDELWSVLWLMLKNDVVSPNRIGFVGISSVVPELTSLYKRITSSHIGCDVKIISYLSIRELEITYDPPSAVGPDRLCGSVAAVNLFGAPVIVVDLGTATVLDVVSQEKEYLGGVIAPGVATAADSLHKSASLLPAVELRFPDRIIGRSTESAIQSGVLYGAIEMIDGLVSRIQHELADQATVVATGGFAQLVQSKSRTIQHVEPDLVLHGIRLIADA